MMDDKAERFSITVSNIPKPLLSWWQHHLDAFAKWGTVNGPPNGVVSEPRTQSVCHYCNSTDEVDVDMVGPTSVLACAVCRETAPILRGRKNDR